MPCEARKNGWPNYKGWSCRRCNVEWPDYDLVVPDCIWHMLPPNDETLTRPASVRHEQPRTDEQLKENRMPEINWIRIGEEIGKMQGGIATLRVLQAHKISRFESGAGQSCTIDMVIDYAYEAKNREERSNAKG